MRELKGTSKLNIKLSNRSQILKFLRCQGPCARSGISKNLALTQAGVSLLIAEMLEEGVLWETCEDECRNKPGKNGMLVDIHYGNFYTLGCHVGDTHVYSGLADIKGRIQYTAQPRIFDPSQPYSILEKVNASIQDTLSHTGQVPIGVGLGINNELFRKFLPELQLNVFLRDGVKNEYPDVSVIVDIASRQLALAQIDFGMTPDMDNMLFLQVANSLDMSMTIHGELWNGAHGNMGWLDHVVIDPNGELCECGKRGCVKTVMTIEGILGRARKVYSKETTPVLYRVTEGNPNSLEYDHLKIASRGGDKPIMRIYERDDSLFFSLLQNLLTLFDPEKCVVQGIGLYANEFVERLNQQAEKTFGEQFGKAYELSFINEKNIFLGGNAAAGRRFFYEAAACFRGAAAFL